VEHWDSWLVTIIVGHLDRNIVSSWQLHQRNTELPRYKDLEAFLANRCVAIETASSYSFESSEALSIRVNEVNCSSKRASQGASSKRLTLAASSESNRDKCSLCEAAHKLYACLKFKELSVSDRFSHVLIVCHHSIRLMLVVLSILVKNVNDLTVTF